MSVTLHIGTAGWSIPRDVTGSFPGEGSQLNRYARVLGCTEINTTFSRTHRESTFERWAGETPEDFRFSAKLPKAMTHDARLRVSRADVDALIASLAGLGERLAVLLVQLPPSLDLEPKTAWTFFRALRAAFNGAVMCEPRHPSWFTASAQRLLREERIGRVAADPARPPGAFQPGGWMGEAANGRGATIYYRWHGSPRTYWSRYDNAWLLGRAQELLRWPDRSDIWCIFDNTASGAAAANALQLQALFRRDRDNR